MRAPRGHITQALPQALNPTHTPTPQLGPLRAPGPHPAAQPPRAALIGCGPRHSRGKRRALGAARTPATLSAAVPGPPSGLGERRQAGERGRPADRSSGAVRHGSRPNGGGARARGAGPGPTGPRPAGFASPRRATSSPHGPAPAAPLQDQPTEGLCVPRTT